MIGGAFRSRELDGSIKLKLDRIESIICAKKLSVDFRGLSNRPRDQLIDEVVESIIPLYLIPKTESDKLIGILVEMFREVRNADLN